MDLCERIKNSRKKAGFTQVEFSELVGISPATVSELESGNAQGSSHLVKIASVLGVSPNWLYFGVVDSEFPTNNLSKRELHLVRSYRLLNEPDKKIMERIASSLQELK